MNKDEIADCLREKAKLQEAAYLREKAAAEYLRSTYGHGAAKTLSKLRCVGGGPVFHKCGRVVVYTQSALDTWATGKISGPLRSTSELAAA